MKKALLIFGAVWILSSIGKAIISPNSAKESFEKGVEKTQEVEKKVVGQTPVPTQAPVDTLNQELRDQRKSFDEKKGNNAQSAETAQALMDLSEAASPDSFFDVYVKTEVSDKDLKKFEEGGDKNEFKNKVSFVGVNIVIDSKIWSNSSEDQKKNLLASWSKIFQNEYSNAGGWLSLNNGIRDVAEVTWMKAEYGKSPEIKLK